MLRVLRPLLLIACLAVLATPSAQAHEALSVAGFDAEVGWASEPALVGFPNAIFFSLSDSAGRPVRDLGTSLKVEVGFGTEKTPAMPFVPAETPGEYGAAIIPTRAGGYTVRLVGTIRGRAVDVTREIEEADEPVDIKFPVKDPSLGEIAKLVDGLGPRVDALGSRIDAAAAAARDAKDAVDLTRILAMAGVALGALALITSVVRRPKKSP